MTMHLARGLTTINTKKRKKKLLTQKQIETYTVQWRQHNKSMRKKNMHELQYDTVEDYIAYCRGESKPKVKKESSFIPYKPDNSYQRTTPNYPSLSNTVPTGGGTKKESLKYTGDLIVGIATMHKSNLVPVMRGTDQAKDIATMRR